MSTNNILLSRQYTQFEVEKNSNLMDACKMVISVLLYISLRSSLSKSKLFCEFNGNNVLMETSNLKWNPFLKIL